MPEVALLEGGDGVEIVEVLVHDMRDVPFAAYPRLGRPFGVYVVLADRSFSESDLATWQAVSALLVLLGCRSFWLYGRDVRAFEDASDRGVVGIYEATAREPALMPAEGIGRGGRTAITAVVGSLDELALFLAWERGEPKDDPRYAWRLLVVFSAEDRERARAALARELAQNDDTDEPSSDRLE